MYLVYEDMQKLLEAFNGSFNYQYLANDYYKIIYDKISKYNEQMENMKRKIMEKVNKKGNFEDIEKENKVSGTQLNLKFENILNNQLIDEDEKKSLISKNKNNYKKPQQWEAKGHYIHHQDPELATQIQMWKVNECYTRKNI